jgi:Na+-driven multidrug efflux pump
VCFLSATAVAGRFGAAALGAHQVALSLWLFCALLLDALAIAAQSLVGAALGASRVAEAKALARQITVIGLLAGLGLGALVAAGWHVLPRLLSTNPEVYAQAAQVWPWFIVMQPIAGVVFAQDGVLIGAGDLGFMRDIAIFGALAGFLPLTWLSLAFGWGLAGVWAGLTLFVVLRLFGVMWRVRGGRWAVAGAER